MDGERGCGWEPSRCGAGAGPSAPRGDAGLSGYSLTLFSETVVFLVIECIRWPVQQTCYRHSSVINRFVHLLAPGESIAKGKYRSFYRQLNEPVPSWEPRAALLHPYGHQPSAAQSLGKDPTDVRPPYGCFLIWDVFSNKLFK